MLDRILSNWNIEFSVIWNNGAKVIDSKTALNNKIYNTYFVWSVRPDITYNWKNRAKDIDIIEKNYLCIDVDLRKQYKEKYKEDCSDEDIIETWKQMWEELKDHEFLWDYDYIVFSWNWLHIYYIWESRYISPEIYSHWMERIMREWDRFWGNEIFFSDKACKNIARILRVPWSVNQKTWKQTFIITERQWEWKLFNILESLWESEIEEVIEKRQEETRKKIEEYEKQEKMNRLIKWEKYVDEKHKLEALFKKIDSIPAYLIAEKLIPEFPFDKNWKNFNNEKWWFTWYYYVKDLNSICNWWSQYFAWGDVNSCWTPSVIIKHWFNYNWWEVISWFKNNFNWIK